MSETSAKEIGYVRVVNVRKDMAPDSQPEPGEVIYPVGRSNPVLGNVHFLRNKFDRAEREKVIRANTQDTNEDLARHGARYQELWALAQRVVAGEKICLQCHCKPLPCHSDYYAEVIMKMVEAVKQGKEFAL